MGGGKKVGELGGEVQVGEVGGGGGGGGWEGEVGGREEAVCSSVSSRAENLLNLSQICSTVRAAERANTTRARTRTKWYWRMLLVVDIYELHTIHQL